MDRILMVNRAYNSFRTMYNEGDVELTFNEALVLEVLLKRESSIKEIQGMLEKDRGYICRMLKKLMNRGYIVKERKSYKTTRSGEGEALKNRRIFSEILKEVEGGALIF